ncbi:reverse transcriptase domain-containing protein [Tanacetum coccineum]
MTCIWCKLCGTAIKGHLSMVPIDMEPQPIILAYIDLNLQRELAPINNNNIPNSAEARYGGELAPIFKKIREKQTHSIPKVALLIFLLLFISQRAVSSVDKMLKRCEDTNLVLNWEKCHFMVKEGIVLGHKILKSGIETPFIYSTECREAFKTLKKKLTEAPILVALDWDLPFEIMCDASDFAVGSPGATKDQAFSTNTLR